MSKLEVVLLIYSVVITFIGAFGFYGWNLAHKALTAIIELDAMKGTLDPEIRKALKGGDYDLSSPRS